jgi:hypothetical protein
MRLIISGIIMVIMILPGYAGILSVPSEKYPDIQTAIDSATVNDTVLVDPGTYNERIDFSGKNIIVASRYLTEPDTGNISGTVINGQNGGTTVSFQNGEDSTAQLIGFTITGGFVFPGEGGGINCSNRSGPTLRDLVIRNNISSTGGGLFVYDSSHVMLSNVIIRNNSAFYTGGGIHCDRSSSVRFQNGLISGNTANDDGGGLYLNDSSFIELDSVVLMNNYASYTGGGVSASQSSLSLRDLMIYDNLSIQGGAFFLENCYGTVFDNCTLSGNTAEEEGGGIFALESGIQLKSSRIYHNLAYLSGGGIFTAYSTLSFNASDRSDVFLNFAGLDGNDFYAETDSLITVALDTATILPLTGYQVTPLSMFQIDAAAPKVVAGGGELYVNPGGSDTNNGLTPAAPLKTIACALTKIGSDSNTHGTIHLAPGTYGRYENGDYFPLNMRSFTKITGDDPAAVILDGAYLTPILAFSDDRMAAIENLKLQNAYGYNGGAVYMNNSQADFYHTIFLQNSADLGSALYLENGAGVTLLNSTLVSNSSYGVVYLVQASADIANSIFWLNYTDPLIFDVFSDTSKAVIAYSDIEGGREGFTSADNGTLFWLSGNLAQSPMFEDSVSYDLRLGNGSPCIDAGRQDTVLYYNSDRDSLMIPVLAFNDNNPDMGAIESGVPNFVNRSSNFPDHFEVYQNYPNPFNPVTTIRYYLPAASEVNIRVYNLLGQKVYSDDQDLVSAGFHEMVFDGSGKSSGMYFYVVNAGHNTATRKMLLVK